jgi:hypothetical protein
MARRAAKVDLNHGLIVDTLRACGWLVMSLARLGNGAPDLLVTRQGSWHLIEVKGRKGKLTPMQETFHGVWPVTILRSVDDALELR